ncbi:MAG: flavodoxin family protein [Coriobacteriales bacterium]|nr:flavodoxin family protein [Coriobacteriales bacterium]
MTVRAIESALVISGSPRCGRSQAAAKAKCAELAARGILAHTFFLSERQVIACRGCNHCTRSGACVLLDQNDDWAGLEDLLGASDALFLYAPVYFAGPPAQLKALFDRFQVFWARRYCLADPKEISKVTQKKPAELHILHGNDQHDQHGFDPLIGICRSALNIAGFKIEAVIDENMGKSIPPISAPDTPAQERS